MLAFISGPLPFRKNTLFLKATIFLKGHMGTPHTLQQIKSPNIWHTKWRGRRKWGYLGTMSFHSAGVFWRWPGWKNPLPNLTPDSCSEGTVDNWAWLWEDVVHPSQLRWTISLSQAVSHFYSCNCNLRTIQSASLYNCWIRGKSKIAWGRWWNVTEHGLTLRRWCPSLMKQTHPKGANLTVEPKDLKQLGCGISCNCFLLWVHVHAGWKGRSSSSPYTHKVVQSHMTFSYQYHMQ